MHYFQTAGSRVAELNRIVSNERLDGVTVKPAFMGNVVVIWCGSEHSHDRLVQALRHSPAPKRGATADHDVEA